MSSRLVSTKMPAWITPAWPAPGNILAISTTRQGGHSIGRYAGMNLGDHVGDDPHAVSNNRQQLTERLALPPPSQCPELRPRRGVWWPHRGPPSVEESSSQGGKALHKCSLRPGHAFLFFSSRRDISCSNTIKRHESCQQTLGECPDRCGGAELFVSFD